MRTLITSFAILTSGMLVAQTETETDTTRFRVGSLEFIIVDNDTLLANEDGEGDKDFGMRYTEEDLTYWGGFEVGVNMPMNGNFQPDFNSKHLQVDPAQSFSYSFNFAEQRIRIIKDYFGIVTGLGFTNSRYGFKDDHLRLMSNADSTWGFVDTTLTSGFTKNQLRLNTFNIPILFQINTSKIADKNFHISFGVIGGIRMSSKVKYKYDVLGGENDHKEKGRYNINPFQLSATARVGFRDFGLFANYIILSLYEYGKSETAYPLTFGASFHF